MNKVLKWVLIGLGIALVAFLVALPICLMALRGGHLGIMGPGILGRAGRGMMLMPFLGVLGFLRIVLPLGVLALAIVGVVLLIRGGHARAAVQVPPATPAQPAAEVRTCRKCGKPLPAEGEYCPFCGTKQ